MRPRAGVIGYQRDARRDRGQHAHRRHLRPCRGAAPFRPDRALRALVGLHRWGPTLAAGYLGAAARYPGRRRGDRRARHGDLRRHRPAHQLARSRTRRLRRPRQGDGVAIMCRNHRWFVEASIACSKLGAHAIYLNTSFAAPAGHRGGASARRRRRSSTTRSSPPSSARRCEGRAGFVAWRTTRPGAGPPSARAADRHPRPLPLPPPPEPGRTVILTSGTTGTPKGANRASPSSLGPAAALLSAIPLHARETTMIAAPLFHSWGFAHMFLGTALSSTLVLRRRFDPQDTLRAVAEHRATRPDRGAGDAPADPRAAAPRRCVAYDTSSLRVIAASGSALPGPLAPAGHGRVRRQALQPLRLDRGGLGVDRLARGSAGRARDGRAPPRGHRGQDPRRGRPRGAAGPERPDLRRQRDAVRRLHRRR